LVLAAGGDFPLLEVFWAMLEIFAFVIWAFLVITVAIDIFRSPDLSGWAKAGWLVLVLFLPLIGILAYLIARGPAMRGRAEEWREERMHEAGLTQADAITQSQDSAAAQLSRLADLKQRGVLSAEEFEQEKSKVLSSH
jgi:hypothetical protein